MMNITIDYITRFDLTKTNVLWPPGLLEFLLLGQKHAYTCMYEFRHPKDMPNDVIVCIYFEAT